MIFRKVLLSLFVLFVAFSITSCGEDVAVDEGNTITVNSNGDENGETSNNEQYSIKDQMQNFDVEPIEGESTGSEYTAHYTCPSYCKGSGSEAAGACPYCGSEYVHNDNSDFHKNQQQEQNQDETQAQTQDNSQLIQEMKDKGTSWSSHYTCPSHCEGSGGGAAGACPVCGADYVHNANSLFHLEGQGQ